MNKNEFIKSVTVYHKLINKGISNNNAKDATGYQGVDNFNTYVTMREVYHNLVNKGVNSEDASYATGYERNTAVNGGGRKKVKRGGRKLYTGKRGGKYYLKNGKKVYV